VSPTKARKANSIEGSSIHEPDGGGSRNRGKLEATPSRKAAISSARDSVITSSSHAVTKEPVDKNVRPGLSQEAHVTGPMTETNMLSQTELTPSTAEPLTKERENVSASREAKDEEPASTKAPDANNDHSTTDGASESVPAATKPLANEQKAQKSSTKQHEDQTISTTQAKQANKKAKNKNRIKSHQSRAADILQKTDSPQASGGSPKSENIKPPSKAPVNPTKETFLENAALPQHGDDAAKPRATKKVSEPSVPTSSNHATNDSASQLLPDSSTLENHPGAPNMSTTTEQSPPSIADLSIVSSIPEKQFSHAQLLHGEHVPEVVPIKTDEAVSAMVETTASESIAARNSLSGDQEPESQVMTRNASSSTHREPGSASFEQSSTKQTSYLPTERSNSIVDGPRPEIVHSTSLSARQQGQNAGLDAEKLRTLLEANAASPEGPETVGDSISQPVAVHREQASATAPKAAEPTQALIEDEPLVPPALHSPEKAERCERPKQETARDSSNDTTNSNTESKTGEVATTDSPGKLSHLQAPDFHPVRSMSEEDKQLQMIPSQSCSPQPFSSPIQTRHKKKPKHFAPVKEENSSNAMVPLTEVGTESDDQGSVDQLPEVTPLLSRRLFTVYIVQV